MFQLTKVRITQAAGGGHIIRPLTGDILELHVGAGDEIALVLKPAVYDVSFINCDIFNDTMTFVGSSGEPFFITNGKAGTDALLKNLVILAKPNGG